MGMFLIWWISVWYGARAEGVCWNCFSLLWHGALTEATPQQRRRQQSCGEQRHSNDDGSNAIAMAMAGGPW